SSQSITCVGLLALAMGYGVVPDPNAKDKLDSPEIQRALMLLGGNVGTPSQDANPNTQTPNLYFMWSVERVAMMYDLKTIGGKDWYGWGAQILVHNQSADGAWQQSQYHGANPQLNTCFALLFLKRSNLVQDLTNNLRLYTGIRD